MIDYRDTISTVDDILWVVDRYTGRDNMYNADAVLRGMTLEDTQDTKETLETLTKELEAYEADAEYYRAGLLDTMDILEELAEYMQDAKRWNKEKIEDTIHSTIRSIYNRL